MIVRRVAVVGLIVVTGFVATGSSVAAIARHDRAGSAALRLSAKETKPLTKAQFIAQANALCAAAQMAFVTVLRVAGTNGSPPTSEQLIPFVAAFAPIVQNQITKTRGLNPPKRDRSKVMKILQANQSELNKLKADPELLGGKQSPFLVADSLARAYGLDDAAGAGTCLQSAGQGGGSPSATASS